MDVLNEMPLGTIIQVPKNSNPTKYLEIVPGQTFNKITYKDLYDLLGTDTFTTVSNTIVSDGLPVGSLVHTLNSTVPDGWASFDQTLDLKANVELYNVLTQMASKINDSQTRSTWTKALTNYKLPEFDKSKYFLRYGTAGEFNSATTKLPTIETIPVVEDKSLMLSSTGLAEVKAKITNLFRSDKATLTTKASTLVLLARDAKHYSNVSEVNMYSMSLGGTGTETVPEALHTNLIIKTKSTNNQLTNVLNTHKQVIKAIK